MNPWKIPYNSQRDNKPFAGILPASQCGYTAAAMFLSHAIKRADLDNFVYELVGRMESADQDKPLREAIARVVGGTRRRVGAFGPAYCAAANHLFAEYRVKRQAVFVAGGASIADLERALAHGPVILSTMLSASGHFVCVIGYTDTAFIVHDPYGDARGGYAYFDGESCLYEKAWLFERARKSDPAGKGFRYTAYAPLNKISGTGMV